MRRALTATDVAAKVPRIHVVVRVDGRGTGGTHLGGRGRSRGAGHVRSAAGNALGRDTRRAGRPGAGSGARLGLRSGDRQRADAGAERHRAGAPAARRTDDAGRAAHPDVAHRGAARDDRRPRGRRRRLPGQAVLGPRAPGAGPDPARADLHAPAKRAAGGGARQPPADAPRAGRVPLRRLARAADADHHLEPADGRPARLGRVDQRTQLAGQRSPASPALRHSPTGGASQPARRSAARRFSVRGRASRPAPGGDRSAVAGDRGDRADARFRGQRRLAGAVPDAQRGGRALGSAPPRSGGHQPALQRHQVRVRPPHRGRAGRRLRLSRASRSRTPARESRRRSRTESSSGSNGRPR